MSRIQRRQRHAMIDQEALQIKIANWLKEDPSTSIFFRPKTGNCDEKTSEDSDDENEDEIDENDEDEDDLDLGDLLFGDNKVHIPQPYMPEYCPFRPFLFF